MKISIEKIVRGAALLSLWVVSVSQAQSYITRNGNKLTLGPSGPEIYLRGICLGNRVWENIALPDQAQQEVDYQRIRRMGMNTIRFYINYKTLEDDNQPFQYKTEGWAWLDTNIAWARKNQLYLILNIHVPQGGFQSLCAGNGLWQNLTNQQRFIALWKAIATRYKNETQIAGYDILNEPIPTDSLGQWQILEERTIDTIRSVDTEHLIFSEKAIALNCNYGFENARGNYNVLHDPQLVYSPHTYDPYLYTHQLQSWANTGDGGKYPDENILSLPGDLTYSTGNYNNPRLPAGNSGWTYFTGVPFTVTHDSLIIAKPVFLGNSLGSGKAYFDEITINEVNASGGIVQQILTYNFTSTGNISSWSANTDGTVSFAANGPHDNSSVMLTGASGYASATANDLPFRVFKNKRYQINGWMKGENIPAGASVAITTEFYASPSRQKVYGRNKEYLRSMILHNTKYPRQLQVPIYYGEFGLVRNCFENNKRGERWVKDMVDLFDSLQMHWTYHVYREEGFGLYRGVTGPVDTTTVLQPLKQTFQQYFLSTINDLPSEEGKATSFPIPFPNPVKDELMIKNDEKVELKLILTDVMGKTLEEKVLPSHSILHWPMKQPKGVYFLSLANTQNQLTVRLIKE